MNTTDQKLNILYKFECLKKLRNFFNHQGFIEVSTPYIIKANAPDPFIDPVKISSQQKKNGYQLHTSPELWLKKSLSLGFDKVYELCRVFRDDPEGVHHLIEFDMAEWYRCHASLDDLMDDCKSLVHLFITAFNEIHKQSLPMPVFERRTLKELFSTLADLDLDEILANNALDENYFVSLLSKKGEHLPKNAEFEDAFFHVMVKYIEPNLNHESVTFIEQWPLQLAALSAPCNNNQAYCDRFEMYFQGLEIANAYRECNDEKILRDRFIKENQKRAMLNKQEFPLDEVFLSTVSTLPPMSGIALGVDRLLMAVAKEKNIRNIVFGS